MAYIAAAAFGLVFGSFLNVCVARLPRHESIITPRSHCPRCGEPIVWYDNIPVLSYFILRGRCRHCRQPISLLYPAIELLTAGVLTASYARYGLSPELIKTSILGMLLIILIFTDFTDRRLPHKVTLFGTALGLILSLVIPVDNRVLEWLLRRFGVSLEGSVSSLLGSASGALFGSGFFYAVGEAFYRLRQKEGLGFGDVMLMLMIGSFFGVPLTLLTILLGSLFGTLIAGPLHLASRRFRNYEWPYGSFLGAAAIYVSLGGHALLQAYLRWSGFR